MIIEYQDQYNIKLTNEVDVYCRLEGVSPLFIYRTGEKKEIYPKHKYGGKSLKYLFKKWLGFIKLPSFTTHL
ncbi:hypothetical protein SAMN05444401_0789 [Clostridium amylolyticum]|uniref:Uncharacterized protein n=1 Tax=Clostridium amylolyticum TaxID=1121298 RepID=A0A1M6BIT7_9CLOT|nr:hypothetical protein [Clostridium amylolyticum]SHI48625.1 hypothetical protein SAMN05444401_0789 [Clostridium amylolyticum]